MEELMDFDEWIKIPQQIKIQYWAGYDPESGKVTGIYPGDSAVNVKYKVEIDQEIAESIANGITSIFNCFVDLDDGKFEIVEVKSLTKIDDVLHRVIGSKWSSVVDPDIVILNQNNKIVITLHEKYRNGKKIFWNGETEMDFFITEYNDPHTLYNIFTVKISKLIEKDHVENLPEIKKFSIYTRRLFKNYIFHDEND